MDGVDWGGSEELWSAMAHRALSHGDRILVSLNRWTEKPAAVEALERAGARVVTRSRVRQRALHRAAPPLPIPVTLVSLRRFGPDVVCLSHGATWDVARDPGLFSALTRFFERTGVPY